MSFEGEALLASLVIATVFVAGCLGGGSGITAPPPNVMVSPCNVASKGVQIRISADQLDTKVIVPVLSDIFVDDFKSDAATEMAKTLTAECYWGSLVGERRDYYYCAGKYMAPELDENRVIKRYIWKEYKVGFSVEEHNIGTWVDASGETHNEGSVFYLTTRTIDASCYLA